MLKAHRVRLCGFGKNRYFEEIGLGRCGSRITG